MKNLEIQNKIVKEIEKMNNEAIKYQNMAKTFLENAKTEVEKLYLNNLFPNRQMFYNLCVK